MTISSADQTSRSELGRDSSSQIHGCHARKTPNGKAFAHRMFYIRGGVSHPEYLHAKEEIIVVSLVAFAGTTGIFCETKPSYGTP